MKLASATLFPFSLPYLRTVEWAYHSESANDLLLLRLDAEDGSVGVGEITVKPRWYGTTYRTLIGALEDIFLPIVRTIDLSEPESFSEAVQNIPENTLAKALVDNALCDLRAARHPEPFWAAAGNNALVPSCWVLTRAAPSLMGSEAADMVHRYGFKTIKLKGGQGLAVDVEAVRAVRAAAGDSVKIFVDANGHYPHSEAAEYLATLAAEGVCAVEDPYDLLPDRAFERVQLGSPIPIIVDLACASVRDAHMFFEHGVQAIAVKPGRIGLSEAAKIAAAAARNDCAVHVGLAGESEVGSLAALGAAVKLTTPVDWLPAEATFFLLLAERIVREPLRIAGGEVTMPFASGLAELIDWERVGRYRR